MGIYHCESCGDAMCGYSEATECGCYECLCDDCITAVCEATLCDYCEGEYSCDRCEMVTQDGAWLSCPAPDCPLNERLQDNCCEHCWHGFLAELGNVAGLLNITSAVTGDFIKQLNAFDTDSLHQVWREMAKHLSLPEANLAFVNPQHCVLARSDRVTSMGSRDRCASTAASPCVTAPKKVMMIEWLPGQQALNRETGQHACRTLPCGHLSCSLACKTYQDGCQVCRENAAKAEAKRLAQEKARQAKIEADNILSDLRVLQRIKVKSNTCKAFISRLAAKAEANAPILKNGLGTKAKAKVSKARQGQPKAIAESVQPTKKQKTAVRAVDPPHQGPVNLSEAAIHSPEMEIKAAATWKPEPGNVMGAVDASIHGQAARKAEAGGTQPASNFFETSCLELECSTDERSVGHGGEGAAQPQPAPKSPKNPEPDSLEMELERLMNESSVEQGSAKAAEPQPSPKFPEADSLEMELERLMNESSVEQGSAKAAEPQPSPKFPEADSLEMELERPISVERGGAKAAKPQSSPKSPDADSLEMELERVMEDELVFE